MFILKLQARVQEDEGSNLSRSTWKKYFNCIDVTKRVQKLYLLDVVRAGFPLYTMNW